MALPAQERDAATAGQIERRAAPVPASENPRPIIAQLHPGNLNRGRRRQ